MSELLYELPYPISTNYIQTWTWQDGVREFLQNWLDAGGGDLEWDGHTLIMRNDGVLTETSLILGESDKPSESLGKFGEGYKIGALALLRDGKHVTILSGHLQLTAVLKPLSDHQPDCLHFRVSHRGDHVDNTVVEISPFAAEEQSVVDMLRAPEPEWVTNHGEILKQRKVYLNGLYVGSCDDIDPNLVYGYNLPASQVDTNRDRKMVSNWDFFYQCGRIWSAMLDIDQEQVLSMILSQSADAQYMRYHVDEAQKGRLATRLMQENVLLVSNNEMAAVAKRAGYNPVINRNYGELTNGVLLDYDRKDRFAGALQTPTPKQHAILERIMTIATLITDVEVQPVLKTFSDDTLYGQFNEHEDGTKEIFLQPADFATMLQTTLHEIAHWVTDDEHGQHFQTTLATYHIKLIRYYESQTERNQS